VPLAKIHVVEGRYDETRIAKVSSATQAALMNTLRVPPKTSTNLSLNFRRSAFSTHRLSLACVIPTT
jgi:hypothetical protein